MTIRRPPRSVGTFLLRVRGGGRGGRRAGVLGVRSGSAAAAAGRRADLPGRSSLSEPAPAAAPPPRRTRARLVRGLAATIDGDLAAAHHDADLPSVFEELPFDRQERRRSKNSKGKSARDPTDVRHGPAAGCCCRRPSRRAVWGGFKNDDDDDDAESQTSTLPEQPTAALESDVAKLTRERALRNPGLFSADGLFAPTEEPDFEFDGDGELDELTSADFGEDPYLHVDT